MTAVIENLGEKIKLKIKNMRLPKYEAVFSLSVLLLPFTFQYASPISLISFGELVLIIVSAYGLLKWRRWKLNPISKGLLALSLAFVFLTCITSVNSTEYFQWSEAITIILRMVMYFFVIMLATKYFDIKCVEKVYFVIVYLMAAYLFAQVIAYNAAHEYLPIYLKFDWLYLPERRGATQILSNYYEGGYYTRFRPSALFMEPNYYAFFIVPALYYLVLKKKKPLLSLPLYASLVLSTSGAGFLMGAFAYVIYMAGEVAEKRNGKIHFNIVSCICSVVAMIAAALYFKNDPSRIVHSFDSYSFRVTRGFKMFDLLSLFYKFFGVGMNNVGTYGGALGQMWYFWSVPNEGGSFSMSFVQYGFIGGLVFIGTYIYMLFSSKGKKLTTIFVVLFIIYTVTDSNMFNYRMAYILAYICYFYRTERSTLEKDYKITAENLLPRAAAVV